MVTGAPGSGKSTVIPELVRLSPGNLAVMDMDELLDDHGRLLGIDIASPTAAPIWPAYNALWLRITELIRRSGMPVLLLSGRHDYVFPYDTSQRPLFELLGTPASEKRHVVFDAGHDPLPRSQVIREILAWLDKYLGPV